LRRRNEAPPGLVPAESQQKRNHSPRSSNTVVAVRAAPTGESEDEPTKEDTMLAIAGTGYSLIGLLVIILLAVLIVYFVRRV
jgi:hypothetical protein